MRELSRPSLLLVVLGLVGTSYGVDRLVPSQYATIQAAIDASSRGDVVLVAPGSHAGPIDTKGKAITVRGTTDASMVFVVGGQSVLRCVSGEGPSTLIERLTFTGGSGTFGGGIRIVGASPTIRNCNITGNNLLGPGETWGGGIAIENGSPLIENCLVGGNLSHPPMMGIWPQCYWASDGITRGKGGGVYINGGSPTLKNCNISGNEIRCIGATNGSCRQPEGGGVYKTGIGHLTLDNCVVSGNLLKLGGGVAGSYSPEAKGCAAWIDPPATIRNTRFSVNRGLGGGLSFGLYLTNPGVTLTNSVVCDNDGGNLVGPFVDGGGNRINATCESCTGDVNGDGRVDGVDIATVLGAWGTCP
jgi:hypothetical protein